MKTTKTVTTNPSKSEKTVAATKSFPRRDSMLVIVRRENLGKTLASYLKMLRKEKKLTLAQQNGDSESAVAAHRRMLMAAGNN